MGMKSFLTAVTIAIISLVFISCSTNSLYQKVYPTLLDGKYDSEFPYRNCSNELEEISNSIKLVNSIAFYTSYIFDEKSKVTLSDINLINYEKTSVKEILFNRTASCSATIILENNGLVGLLTVAHVVSFPDTILTYFSNNDGSLSQNIQSISIKNRQSNYVPDLPKSGDLEIILIDKIRDIALLGKKFSPDETKLIQTFNYKWGYSHELEWGSFVYAFGYPMNYKMISKAIVSISDKSKNTFIIDAAFNKGFSGGIVLAIRDGVPNFELVGIVKSVPAEYEDIIKPLVKDQESEINPMLPYKGDVYIERQQIISPGITKVIAIESVKELFFEHKDELIRKGFYFKNLFSPDSIKSFTESKKLIN